MYIMATGHRPPRIGGWITPNPTEQWIRVKLREILEALKAKDPDLVGISGMALGFDQIFAEECCTKNIPFIAAIPFEGQENRWPTDSQVAFRLLLKQAKEIMVVDQIPEYQSTNPKVKFILRDKWMVDHANSAIAAWDGLVDGGTGATIKLITKKRMKYIHLDPKLFTVRLVEPIPLPSEDELEWPFSEDSL